MWVHRWEPPWRRTTIESTSPTVWRRWLARQLKAMRVEHGLDQKAVSDRLRSSVAKVSYIESGERPFRVRDLTEILLPLYEVPEADWPQYVRACELSRRRGWWHLYDEEVVPSWFADYIGLEQGASTLRGFTMQLVPGLLQTPAYATTIMGEDASALEPEEAAGRTEVRLRRQKVLAREPEPLQVHYILDESVLRRRIGGPTIMTEQLEHLATLAAQPNITLQVLPFDKGYYFDGKGEPVLLGFPWPDDPGVVYVESRLRGELLAGPHEVADYTITFDHLRHVALPPVDSIAMINDLTKENNQ
jgi:transcriptional regulator with XRE-family HTH domain